MTAQNTPPTASTPYIPPLAATPGAFLRQMFRPPAQFPVALEQEFKREYAERFAVHRRASIILAFATWTVFIAWDLYHSTQSLYFRRVLPEILLLRASGSLILITIAILYHNHKVAVGRHATALLTLGICTTYAILLVIIMIVPFPFNYLYYYIGLLLVMTFMFGVFRLRAQVVIWLTTSCVLSALVLRWAPTAPPGTPHLNVPYYFVAAVCYLISFGLVGCAVAVELERTARNAFLRERELAHRQAALSAKNDELASAERAARNRSADLEAANLALQAAEQETQAKTDALVAMKDDLRILAERQNVEKSKFLAEAAHDLRQPMQALTSFLEAASHALSRQDVRTCGTHIEEAQSALSLTLSSFNAVLDISRLESGLVDATYLDFDINELLESLIVTFTPLARSRGVLLRSWRHKEPIFVRSDPELLRRVLSNLVANGIKYGDHAKSSRQTVLIGVVRLSNKVRIDVVDNGIGIPRDQWARVFQPFVQLNNPERDRDKGVGLGLSIVNAIVNLLAEHRIDMRSNPGRGTRISTEVPRGNVVGDEGGPAVLSYTRGAPVADVGGIYVLYVEDDQLVRRSTEALFDRWGILRKSVGSVGELRDRLSRMERAPDLVITDYRLPLERTAADVVDQVREHFGDAIPLILVTGEVLAVEADCWLSAVRVLRKPVSPWRLLQEISQFSLRPEFHLAVE